MKPRLAASAEVVPFKKEQPSSFRWNWLRGVLASGLLRPTEKLVAVAICRRANAESLTCWPSMNTLARDTGLAHVTVRKAVAVLRHEKWLSTTLPKNRSSLCYRLRMAYKLPPE